MELRNCLRLLTIAITFLLIGADDSVDSGYIFTSPRSLKIGSNNELQLLRFGCFDAGQVKVRLYYSESYNSNETLAQENDFELEEGKKYTFLNLPVNPFNNNYVYNGRIQINGTIGSKSFSGSDKVYFSTPKNKIIIIQTDKPLYQPGQKVLFRVLKLNDELKPSDKDDDVADVFVEDGKGTRLFQFKNVELGKGMQQMEIPLSEEPIKGTWKITVNSGKDTESTTFEVKEYVLPKFEIKINYPSFVLANADSIPIEICAKYTYGKPVVGQLKLNISEEKYSWSREKIPTIEETIKINGCFNYTLNVTQIAPENGYRYRRIQTFASVVEDGTGVEINKTEYLQRQYSPLNLNFNTDSNQRQYYKPGLPYNGKLRVTLPDNTPAKNVDIELCMTQVRKRIISGYYGTRKIQICKNYTSNENGDIKFTITPQNVDSTSIQVQAKAIQYAKDPKSANHKNNILNQPESSLHLTPFYSPSGNFIQLENVGRAIPCDDQQNFKLLFTSKTDQDFKFHYEILRQGKVVFTGKKEVSFSKNTDDVSEKYRDDNEVISGPETQLIPPPQATKDGDSDAECPSARDIKYIPPIGEVIIPLDISKLLSPSFTLLVFYVREDRETVADSQKFEVQKCFKNEVDLEFGDDVKQPGTKTSLKVTASPNSLCGIKVVDKSVSLLDSSDQLTTERVFQLLENMDTNIYYSSNPCNENKPQPGLYTSDVKVILPPGPYSNSNYEDSFAAFQTSGLLVISNLIFFTRPCQNNEGGSIVYEDYAAPGGASGFGGGIHIASSARRPAVRPPAPQAASVSMENNAATKSVVEIRDYFPETWLFQMDLAGPDGIFVTKEKLPHTITEWVGSAVCVNSEDGLGISNSTSIKGFQAFFISYTLPASVIRGEEFWLVVSIFNYADGALPITVSLDQSEGFEVTSESIDGDVCVLPDQSQNQKIKLKATKLGSVNITVRAQTADSSAVCAGSTVSDAVAKDAITKPITVEAEGFPAETVENFLFCPTDLEDHTYKNTIALNLPNDIVPDSARSLVDVTGNVLGPAIQNLDRLVALPTGCGEQNMVKFTPNYLVLDYLTSIGQLDDRTKAIAIKNLNTGYQRQLTYRHSDGSFSAFGEIDRNGSMFLTAFVLRSFSQAKRYITIDNSVITRAVDWIVSKQRADGCFPDVGKIIDSGLGGGIEREKGTGSITAYVVASLMLSDYENRTVIDNALSCMEEDTKHLRPYEQYLYAYAEALSGKEEAAKKRIEETRPLATTGDGTEYYRNPNGTKAINLETVAYAVLANLKLGENAGNVLGLIRYMTQNMNPNGGFHSTQDTCVGLDALKSFAKLVYKDPVDILVELNGALQKKVEISQDNKLLVQRSLISQIPSELSVQATGSGCGLLRTLLRYNTKTPPEKNEFNFQVIGQCADNACKTKKITTIVSYKPDKRQAGMSVVQIKMITGTVPVKESLEQLVADTRNHILRFDVQNNEVTLYFSHLSNDVQQFSFNVEEVVAVENPQPAAAKVFDYYAPEIITTTSYSFGVIVQNNRRE